MTTTPGADERRIRAALDDRGVTYAPQPPANARDRDWLDDIIASGRPEPFAPHLKPAAPPAPPPEPPGEAPAAADEPRWDWRRLLHWPHAKPATAGAIALVATFWPIPDVGYSVATTWAYCVHQIRDNYGAGWGYVVGGGLFALAVRLVAQQGRRAGILRLVFLAVTLIGLTGAFNWFDLIIIVTGGHPR